MKPESLKAWAIALGSVLAILAASGEKAFAALAGFPLLIRAFSTNIPGGLWAFLLASAVAGGLHFWVRTWHGRSLGLEAAILLAGCAVTHALAWRSDAGAHVSAFLIGLLAGMAGLFASKALVAWRGRKPA